MIIYKSVNPIITQDDFGFCKGLRLAAKKVMNNVIEATILKGQ